MHAVPIARSELALTPLLETLPEGVRLDPMTAADLPVLERLHATAFGPGRFARSAYRIREGAPTLSPHCRVARRGEAIVGGVSMTQIRIGNSAGHWLLGPLAVVPGEVNRGIGQALVRSALASVAAAGNGRAIVLLVGDLAYYGRLGFSRIPADSIWLPGPADPARILATDPADGGPLPSGAVRSELG